MSVVKYQHYIARHHMSWFANGDGTSSFWSLKDHSLLDNVKLTEIGGQNHLYESEALPRNFVEKEILGRIETDFFAARNRAMEHKTVRRSDDRQAVRRYVAAQFWRQGYLHNRIVQMENDLRFIAKEMGVERLWQADSVPKEGGRKRASSLMAEHLVSLDETVKMLGQHVVIFVQRPAGDLLLPDRGFVQIYAENGTMRTDGLKSPYLKILMPIAPNAALKLVRPSRKAGFSDRTTLSDEGQRVFMENLTLNAKTFIAGTRDVLAAADLSSLPRFEPNAERLSMVMQIYRAGILDDMVEHFWAAALPGQPKELVRDWFYRTKFVPAVNKLFNPSGNPNAHKIDFIP